MADGMTASPDPPIDGRRARAEASRSKIVTAIIELAREGQTAPSAEVVAERAGVGLRTVFRLFKDMDGLYREMHETMLRRLGPIAAEPIEGDDWRAQLRSLIHRRARLFEEIMPMQVAADAHRARSAYLQKEHAAFVRLQRSLATALVPEAVLDGQRVEMLDLVMSFDAWRRLRLDQGLTTAEAEALMAALVDRVLAP